MTNLILKSGSLANRIRTRAWQDEDGWLWALLRELGRRRGGEILANTSFNVRTPNPKIRIDTPVMLPVRDAARALFGVTRSSDRSRHRNIPVIITHYSCAEMTSMRVRNMHVHQHATTIILANTSFSARANRLKIRIDTRVMLPPYPMKPAAARALSRVTRSSQISSSRHISCRHLCAAPMCPPHAIPALWTIIPASTMYSTFELTVSMKD